MKKRSENLKNTVNKYMANIRPDWLTTCQSERKSVDNPLYILLEYCERIIIHMVKAVLQIWQWALSGRMWVVPCSFVLSSHAFTSHSPLLPDLWKDLQPLIPLQPKKIVTLKIATAVFAKTNNILHNLYPKVGSYTVRSVRLSASSLLTIMYQPFLLHLVHPSW
jgi:hypothetical protein